MTAVFRPPNFRPVAEHGLLVEFGTAITPEAHAAVLRLDRALAAQPFPGLAEAVPAYVNLLVRFDPLITSHPAVQDHLTALLKAAPDARAQGRLRQVAVCYDPPFAPDLDAVASQTGLTPDAVIQTHLSGQYQVALYGFAPGYAYLSGLPAPIRLPRKTTALRNIPAGSVIIAAGQCIVTTLTMPTGWWIIGRSPTLILDSAASRPFLFDVGDRVEFHRVGPDAL